MQLLFLVMNLKKIFTYTFVALILLSSCASQKGKVYTRELLNEQAIGGDAGRRIGRTMDKQADELRKFLNAKVERVGEGIQVTFETGILFDINSSYLRESTKQNLIDFASVLSKYPDTNILIEGHSDSIGEDKYNKWLSDRRSNSVKNFLSDNGIQSKRMETQGYGEKKPIGDNTKAEGRQANRRVEIAIYANAEMIRKAKAKAL